MLLVILEDNKYGLRLTGGLCNIYEIQEQVMDPKEAFKGDFHVRVKLCSPLSSVVCTSVVVPQNV